MLEPKVHLLLVALSFNTERYTRVKNIITSKYDKVSEVVKARVQAIIVLPIIHGSNPIRIHEFYEKLLIHL